MVQGNTKNIGREVSAPVRYVVVYRSSRARVPGIHPTADVIVADDTCAQLNRAAGCACPAQARYAVMPEDHT